MKIAFIGSRGIPARYSGFETFYEQVAVRLVERGHEVTVFNRTTFMGKVGPDVRGVKIIEFPSIPTKHLDTIFHTTVGSLIASLQGYDIAYFCIVGNSPVVWFPRLTGAKVLLNVDGEDWAREKWGKFAAFYQKSCERIATWSSDLIVSDAKGIQERYQELYQTETAFVPYGANIQRDERVDTLKKFNLESGEYYLCVGRFVPENAFHLAIKAFSKLEGNRKLVIVGDSPYESDYKKELQELAEKDSRVVLTGYAFQDDYAQLSSHAYAFLLPSAVDGTRPVLLDQMGFGNCVVVRNSKVNREVVQDWGVRFDSENPEKGLGEALDALERQPDRVAEYKQRVRERIENYYNWEKVTSFYEELFEKTIKGDNIRSYDDFLSTNS